MSDLAYAFGYDALKKRMQGGAEKYYNVPDFKTFKKGGKAGLKSGYISSSTPLHSGFGNALYSKAPEKIVTSRNPKVGNTYGMSQGLYIYNDPKIAEQQRQQAYQQQLQATASSTQADIAKQLQIVQSEKSAVSKMTQEYTAMLQKEADAKEKAQEEARVSAATAAANQSRSGQVANLQIQPASSTPKTAGTQAFKKRNLLPTSKRRLTSGINLGTLNTLNI